MTASILDSRDFAPTLIGIALLVILLAWAAGRFLDVYRTYGYRTRRDAPTEPIHSYVKPWRGQ